jgi:hypothetical protein
MDIRMDASNVNPKVSLPMFISRDQSLSAILGDFSENFATDILGRYLWSCGSLKISNQQIADLAVKNLKRIAKGKARAEHFTIHFRVSDASSCVITHDALLATFLGKHFEKALKPISTPGEDPALSAAKIKKIMLEKEGSPFTGFARIYHRFFGERGLRQALDDHHWTVYSLQIQRESCEYVHACVILQMIENNRVVYKICQSFVNQYYFEMSKVNAHTSADMFLMLDEIVDFIRSDEWTAKHNHLITHFFKSKAAMPLGEKIGYKSRLILQYADVSRTSLERSYSQFSSAYPADLKIKVIQS